MEPIGRQTILARESLLLAPYAMHSSNSRGRQHAEAEHPYRGPFQRDRDRVVHSSAFRRLNGKMQVFTDEMGDYHRTRLTHTHEVASIARTIGRALRLNEDLVEALALFHDIGHPPFGHAGEDALHECLAADGGFSHNRYALTLAEEIEVRCPSYPGLNLTREVLDGQSVRAHKGKHALPATPGEITIAPLLEVQVVDVADSVTYDAHDTDDAVKLGLVTLAELQELPLIREAVDRIHRDYTDLAGTMLRKVLVHELIDDQVSDVLAVAGDFLTRCDWQSSQDAQRSPFRVGPTSELAGKKAELERFLYARVYRHPRLLKMRGEAQSRLRAMFDGFIAHPELLPDRFQRRASQVGIRRAVGDFLAGMTDRFCDQQFEQHFK